MLSSVVNYFTGSKQEAQQSSYLTQDVMPAEILLHIWNNLEIKDIAALSQTCKEFRYIKNDDSELPGYRLKGQLRSVVKEFWQRNGIKVHYASSGVGALMILSALSTKEIREPKLKTVCYKEGKLSFKLEQKIVSLAVEMIFSDGEKVEKKNIWRKRYVDESCDTIYYVKKITIQKSCTTLPENVRALIPDLQLVVDKEVAELVAAVKKQTMTENRIL